MLVKGVHFYGFHSTYSPFLKVFLVDPAYQHRAVTILQSGTIMKTKYRVFESHLSFVLQFLCDFGLYGCGWIELAETWRRGQDADGSDTTLLDDIDLDCKQSPYHRQSQMPLELDVVAPQILNRHRLAARDLHHELKIPAPPLPSEPLVLSVRELWEDERQRRISRGLHPTPELPRDLSERSRGTGGQWVSEIRWWDEIRKRIEQERGKPDAASDQRWARWVMTTFESVEALWEPQYKSWKPQVQDQNERVDSTRGTNGVTEENPYQAASQGESAPKQSARDEEEDVDVDETMLSSQILAQLVDQGEEEWDNRDNDDREEEEGLPEEAVEFEVPDFNSRNNRGSTASPRYLHIYAYNNV